MTKLKDSSLGPEKRIKSSSEFLRILQARFPEATKCYSEWFEAKALFKFEHARVRYGFTVGKKFAVRSVDRNLVKRLLRESARSNSAAFEALAEEKKVGLDINLRLKKKYVFPAQSLKSLKQEIRADAILIAAVKSYRFLFSPWVGHNCKFLPTCSQYSLTALEKYGAIKGTYLTVCRLLRCSPFTKGGIDEVPEKFKWNCWCNDCTSGKNNPSFLQSTIEQSNHGK